MTETVQFHLHQYMAFKNTVVKNQVHKKMLVANEYAFLPGFETESVA